MREEKIKQLLKEAGGDWKVFSNWMSEQTMGLYSDGEFNYYEYDVERFIRYRCNPENEPLIGLDK